MCNSNPNNAIQINMIQLGIKGANDIEWILWNSNSHLIIVFIMIQKRLIKFFKSIQWQLNGIEKSEIHWF